jgi:hypothetical protein
MSVPWYFSHIAHATACPQPAVSEVECASRKEFRHESTLARELRAEDLAEEMIEIANDPCVWVEKIGADGRAVMVLDHENLARVSLQPRSCTKPSELPQVLNPVDGTPLTQLISTGTTQNRADEMCYDPVDHIVAAVNTTGYFRSAGGTSVISRAPRWKVT